MIGTWERAYAKDGLEGLISMPPGRRRRREANVERDSSEPHEDAARTRQELLEELRQLRMEVAYLKKAKALVRSKSSLAPQNGRG
ncbi:hypothetical protein GmRootV213_05990 [Variovorax sp. V213]